MTTLPAGLIYNNIEFFLDNGEPMVLQNGNVLPYHKSIQGRSLIQADMQKHIELVAALRKEEFSGYELEKQWAACRFGGFDNIPDFNIETGESNTEYHECKRRPFCNCSGHVCLMPSKLSHKEIETIKAISSGEPSKIAADRLNITFNTIRGYMKSVHKKIDAHTRADVMNFAYRNNII